NAELAELARLVETAGADVLGQTYQFVKEITPATLIGSGKVEEIKQQIEELGVNLVIVDANL
ncbi:MAG: GTPase HflX, partial [Clostridia bacterium]|nr:GTPase HflX [Clostridia bacterium]